MPALAVDPPVLLMDEQFAALDAQTRKYMQSELLKIWAEFKVTVIFITHQIDEAIYLSDKVVVMTARPGRLLEEIDIEIPRPRALRVKRSRSSPNTPTGCGTSSRARARSMSKTASPRWKGTLLSPRLLWRTTGVLSVLAIWQFLASSGMVDELLVSSPIGCSRPGSTPSRPVRPGPPSGPRCRSA